MFRLFKFLKTAALFFSLASVVSCMEENIIPLNEVTAEHGKVFEKDGEKWVSLNLNSMNEDLQSARSVIAENPLLYFSVTASTLKSGTGVNLKADCSYSASAAAGTYVAHPYYASQRNKMNGLNLTLKVGRAYWFTVYGTSSAPTSLCANDSAVLDADFTGCTAYSDFSTLGSKQAAYLSSLGAGIYTSSSDYNGELVYYGIRQRITELLEQDAVVKGSVQYYIGDDDDGNVLIYKGADSSGLPVQVMTVEVDSDGIEGTGHAFIPVELQETSLLSSVGLEVRRIRFYWTSRTDSSDDGYMQVPVGAGLRVCGLREWTIRRSGAKFSLFPGHGCLAFVRVLRRAF